jgi:hypothetical protein
VIFAGGPAAAIHVLSIAPGAAFTPGGTRSVATLYFILSPIYATNGITRF